MARFTDLRRPFSKPEAWVYDLVLADGILSVVHPLLDEVIESVGPDDRILDVGCGGGHEVLALAQAQPDVQVVGIDLSTVGLRRATRRTRGHRVDNATFVRASALRLPFPTGVFAASVSFFSIKHWPDPRVGIAELLRVTRPEGRLLVVEINAHATPAEWRRYVDLTRIPRPLRHLYVQITYPTVVRHSLERDTLEAAFPEGPQVGDLYVEVVQDLPYLVARGKVLARQ
jgi:ubiquinone/menaquinone biosynthesis C-methylase UbiE